MRLNLYWRGWDVIDIEAHLWRKRADAGQEDAPTILVVGGLADASLAEAMDYPDTTVRFGFGSGGR